MSLILTRAHQPICRSAQPLLLSLLRQAEFRALYLPSLLRTFFNTPIDTFDAISPHLFASIGSLVKVHVPSAAGHRFIREHPEEAVELRIKAMNLILDWSDRINTVSSLSSVHHQWIAFSY